MLFSDRNMKKVYVVIVVFLLGVAVLLWFRFGRRPAGVPATAVLISGNYIDCVSSKLPIGHPCSVYNGWSGKVLDEKPLVERLKSISSTPWRSAIDCGRTSTRNPDPKVAECGLAAFKNHKSFYVQYYSPDTTFSFAYGLAGDAKGNVFSIVYQDFPFPSIASSRHAKLVDQNH